MTTVTAAGRTERVDGGKILRAGLVGAVLAAVANVVLWAILQFALRLNLQVQMGDPTAPLTDLAVVPVVLASMVPAIGAGILLAVLARFTARPYTIFLAVAAVFLLLSLFGPFSMAVPLATQVSLVLMHIIAAAAIVWALVTQTRAS